MRLLIKLGGTLLDTPDSRERLAAEITEVARTAEVVVVHGGGKQMTRFLTERGVESRFVNGLRVTRRRCSTRWLKCSRERQRAAGHGVSIRGSETRRIERAGRRSGGRGTAQSGTGQCRQARAI